MKKGERTYKVLDEIQIDFLAGCAVPAQAGAVALLMKRHDPDAEKIEKDSEGRLWKGDTPGILTSSTNGHTHIIWLHGSAGESTMQRDSDENGPSEGHHDHPWILAANGSIEVGDNLGHTHSVDAADVTTALVAAMNKAHPTAGKTPARKEIEMPDDKTLKALEKRLEKAEDRAKKAEERADLQSILGGLTPTQKAHFDTLGDPEKAVFVTKSNQLRDDEIEAVRKAAEVEDPIVYRSTKGIEVRKSDGPTILALAKQGDEDRERADKAEKALAGERLTKTAEALSLPGTTEQTVALLKAVETIPEGPERDAAMAALTAGSAAIEKGFGNIGSLAPSDPEDGGAGTIAKMVKAHMEANPGVNEAHATRAVTKTPEGRAAYEAIHKN